MEQTNLSVFYKVFFYRVALVISMFIVLGCARSEEVLFKKKVHALMNEKNIIETDFTNFVDYRWDEVCFGYGPAGKLTFIDSKLNKKVKLKFDLDEFYINEKYFIDSPSKKCFLKGQVFIIERASGFSSEKLLIKYKRKIK